MKKTWSCWTMPVGSLVLILIALVAAPAVPVTGAPSVRACDLLALTDVTGLLGGGFTARPDVALTGSPTQSHCAYHSTGGSVVITLHKIVQDAAQYLQSEQAGIAQQRGVTVTPVVGLGAGAFYFQGPNPPGGAGAV